MNEGMWILSSDDRKLLSLSIANSPVYNVTAKRTKQEITNSRLDECMRDNIESFFPMYFTRYKFQQYSRIVDTAVRTMMLSELKEQGGMTVSLEGCVDFLRSQFHNSCDYYMPVVDPVYQAFVSLCQSRHEEGVFIVDFKSYWKNARDQVLKKIKE